MRKAYVETFDIDGRWNEIEPFLDHPRAVRALDAGMKHLCACRGDQTWDRTRGPWMYSDPDSPNTFPTAPLPGTPNWYRCWGACYAVGAWCGAIGELALPNLEWYVMVSNTHSAAVGGRFEVENGQEVAYLTLMDILWGCTTEPEEIFRSLNDKGRGRSYDVDEAIDMLELNAKLRSNRHLTIISPQSFLGSYPSVPTE